MTGLYQRLPENIFDYHDLTSDPSLNLNVNPLRKNIVRLLKKGNAPNEVAAMLDVSRSLVYATKITYDEKGIEGT